MRQFPFPYVTVTDQFGHMVDIMSVSEAAVWLVAQWPTRSGGQHEKAKQICVDALAGKCTCTDCRNAFIAAAKEAGIYITHKRL